MIFPKLLAGYMLFLSVPYPVGTLWTSQLLHALGTVSVHIVLLPHKALASSPESSFGRVLGTLYGVL